MYRWPQFVLVAVLAVHLEQVTAWQYARSVSSVCSVLPCSKQLLTQKCNALQQLTAPAQAASTALSLSAAPPVAGEPNFQKQHAYSKALAAISAEELR
jgi:hypothetical protein